MPRLSRLLVASALLGLGAVLLGPCALVYLGRFLVVSDPLPQTADAVVVLAGAPQDRLAEAARLVRAGLAPRVVLTRERLPTGGVALAREGARLPEGHDLSRQALRALGVADDSIVTLRRRASSTTTEARVIADAACRRDWRRLVVVTSPSHTRRAQLILRRALPATVALAVRPAPGAYFPASRWWARRHVAKRVLFEYQKLLNFWLRERWTIAPCRTR
jgi:uncharacterized SAM-binding protein YcdF (DUF218 family)